MVALEASPPLASVIADVHGRFTASIVTPEATPGMYALVASAADLESGLSLQATSSITIIAAASTPAETASSPAADADPTGGSSTAATRPTGAAGKTPTPASPNVAATGSSGAFKSEADARVEEAHPSANFGQAPILGVDGDPNARIQSLVRFTVSGISAPIQRAILRLHVTSNGGSDGPWVLPANNNWKESSVTWMTSPPTWGHPTSDLGPVAADSWISFDVTSLVTKNGQYTFKLAASSVDGIEFSSRESLQPPQLLINQDAPVSPTQVPVSPTLNPSPTLASTPLPASTANGVATAPVSPTPGQQTSTENPFAGATFYVDPASAARAQAIAWRSTRPADASEMDKIANQPQADWFDNGSGDIRVAVDRRVSTIASAAALPVLVAYNIPKRDCAGGGATSASAYRTWIRGFASAIGSRKAVVILEPDALANIGCLSSADQTTRLGLIKDAVNVLEAQPGVAVYIDAGHSNWVSASTMAGLLSKAGIDKAQGFSLNVASFGYTSDNIAYGRALSSRVGGKHFIIDTSRNGLGPAPDFAWCNPSGRALGPNPTASTGDPLVDAYFWIKRPGESDGTCNGGPVAGLWWADYALGLAQRAP